MGGVNYRGRQAIGYEGGYTTATLVLGYNFRLSRRCEVRLDFKVDNLFDYDDPLYVNTVQRPVGGDILQPARVATLSNLYYLTPRNYTLTASLRF